MVAVIVFFFVGSALETGLEIVEIIITGFAKVSNYFCHCVLSVSLAPKFFKVSYPVGKDPFLSQQKLPLCAPAAPFLVFRIIRLKWSRCQWPHEITSAIALILNLEYVFWEKLLAEQRLGTDSIIYFDLTLGLAETKFFKNTLCKASNATNLLRVQTTVSFFTAKVREVDRRDDSIVWAAKVRPSHIIGLHAHDISENAVCGC